MLDPSLPDALPSLVQNQIFITICFKAANITSTDDGNCAFLLRKSAYLKQRPTSPAGHFDANIRRFLCYDETKKKSSPCQRFRAFSEECKVSVRAKILWRFQQEEECQRLHPKAAADSRFLFQSTTFVQRSVHFYTKQLQPSRSCSFYLSLCVQ